MKRIACLTIVYEVDDSSVTSKSEMDDWLSGGVCVPDIVATNGTVMLSLDGETQFAANDTVTNMGDDNDE